jgi:hypothetical protein
VAHFIRISKHQLDGPLQLARQDKLRSELLLELRKEYNLQKDTKER